LFYQLKRGEISIKKILASLLKKYLKCKLEVINVLDKDVVSKYLYITLSFDGESIYHDSVIVSQK
jgi:hypothetical protein